MSGNWNGWHEKCDDSFEEIIIENLDPRIFDILERRS